MPERSFGKAISASRELAERKGKGEAARLNEDGADGARILEAKTILNELEGG